MNKVIAGDAEHFSRRDVNTLDPEARVKKEERRSGQMLRTKSMICRSHMVEDMTFLPAAAIVAKQAHKWTMKRRATGIAFRYLNLPKQPR